jgi:hypothetical protein
LAGHEVDVEGAGHGGGLYPECYVRSRINFPRNEFKEREERFLSAQPDTFAGANVKKKRRAAPFKMTVVGWPVGRGPPRSIRCE